jgi:hypothetical protein
MENSETVLLSAGAMWDGYCSDNDPVRLVG